MTSFQYFDHVRESYGRLRSAQKPRKGTPAYTLIVNRFLGRLIAACAPRALSSDAITLVSALATIVAVVLVVAVEQPGIAMSATVAATLVLGYALDSADGQVSRLRSTSSAFGEWLDHYLDSIKVAVLHMGTLFTLQRADVVPDWVALVLVACFLTSAHAIFFGGILHDKLSPHPVAPLTVGKKIRVRSLLLLPVDYGVLCLCYFLLAWDSVFTATYAGLALAHMLFAVAFSAKWARSLKRQAGRS